jgi:hypothetical protein
LVQNAYVSNDAALLGVLTTAWGLGLAAGRQFAGFVLVGCLLADRFLHWWRLKISQGIKIGGVHSFGFVDRCGHELLFLPEFVGGRTDWSLLRSMRDGVFAFGNFDADIDYDSLSIPRTPNSNCVYFTRGVIFIQ